MPWTFYQHDQFNQVNHKIQIRTVLKWPFKNKINSNKVVFGVHVSLAVHSLPHYLDCQCYAVYLFPIELRVKQCAVVTHGIGNCDKNRNSDKWMTASPGANVENSEFNPIAHFDICKGNFILYTNIASEFLDTVKTGSKRPKREFRNIADQAN